MAKRRSIQILPSPSERGMGNPPTPQTAAQRAQRSPHSHLGKQHVQTQKPEGENGFLAFIPWTFMDDGTLLKRVKGINNNVTPDEYLRMLAICRIMLPNIKNIQTSWLTVGAKTAQLSLHGGANVVSAAGAPHRFTSESIENCILEAGFTPQLRNQIYENRCKPKQMEIQEIDY